MKKKLLFHYVNIYFKILNSCLKTFGFGVYFLYFLIKVPIKLVYVHTSLFLDNIFFPKWRKVKIENPVFIIGHPRSASSFLHKILTSTKEFIVFDNWEIHNPSLSFKKIFWKHKTARILSNFISDFRHTPHRINWEIKNHKKGIKGKLKEHKERSGYIAQEEEMLFLNTLDTQFVAIATPIGFSTEGFPELCYNDNQPHQDRSVQFLKNCFKRQIYFTGKKQIIAKLNFSIFRIKTLLKYFPDAKIIFLIRSPIETQRSHLSLHHTILDNHYGLLNIPVDSYKQYFINRYKYNIEFYKQLVRLTDDSELPRNKFIEITYESIKNDLWETVQRVKDFVNIDISPELEQSIKVQHERQSSYRRPHKNLSLEALNLSEEKIRSDFDFYFKKYEH